MTKPFHTPLLPHHRLRAYGLAVKLLGAVRQAQVRDGVLRDEAVRAAKSACLNCTEGAGRVTPADKARAYLLRAQLPVSQLQPRMALQSDSSSTLSHCGGLPVQ
jgi:hypothetical protein